MTAASAAAQTVRSRGEGSGRAIQSRARVSRVRTVERGRGLTCAACLLSCLLGASNLPLRVLSHRREVLLRAEAARTNERPMPSFLRSKYVSTHALYSEPTGVGARGGGISGLRGVLACSPAFSRMRARSHPGLLRPREYYRKWVCVISVNRTAWSNVKRTPPARPGAPRGRRARRGGRLRLTRYATTACG